MKIADITLCGAGIAGIACAYYLSERLKGQDILLIDKLPPMSLTTSKSGENFREFWPQPYMNDFVNHSIKLMDNLCDAHPDKLSLIYSGYDFVSKNQQSNFTTVYPNLSSDAVTVLNSPQAIAQAKPYLDPSVQQVTHVNNAGSLDVHALGSLMLAQARKNKVRLLQADITGLNHLTDSYEIQLNHKETIKTKQLILCAGPFTPSLAEHLGVQLPIYSIPQRKVVFPDLAGAIPRDMPFTICADAQRLAWSDEELELIGEDPQCADLLKEFPAGLHIKPTGSKQIKMGWAFNTQAQVPNWELDSDPGFADIVLRGATQFIPALAQYQNNIPTPITELAGYYTRTRDNLPVIGPLDNKLMVVSALAGYGTMSACAAGELCADYLSQNSLPIYAKYFSPSRWQDNALMTEINSINTDGQL